MQNTLEAQDNQNANLPSAVASCPLPLRALRASEGSLTLALNALRAAQVALDAFVQEGVTNGHG